MIKKITKGVYKFVEKAMPKKETEDKQKQWSMKGQGFKSSFNPKTDRPVGGGNWTKKK